MQVSQRVSRVLIHLDCLLSDGFDKVLIYKEYELEPGDLQHGVVAQARTMTSRNLSEKNGT